MKRLALLGALVALALGPVLTLSVAAQAAAPPCGLGTTVVWLNTLPGGATAGSTYYNIDFTNLGKITCTLDGFPGVSALSLNGKQIGVGADRVGPHSPVTLKPDLTAHAQLQVADAENYGPRCGFEWAAALQVYMPNQTVAKVVPFPFLACSQPVVILHIEAIEPLP